MTKTPPLVIVGGTLLAEGSADDRRGWTMSLPAGVGANYLTFVASDSGLNTSEMSPLVKFPLIFLPIIFDNPQIVDSPNLKRKQDLTGCGCGAFYLNPPGGVIWIVCGYTFTGRIQLKVNPFEHD